MATANKRASDSKKHKIVISIRTVPSSGRDKDADALVPAADTRGGQG